MKRFDYDFIKDIINIEMLNKISSIYLLKGKLDSFTKKRLSNSDYSLNMNIINEAYYNNDIIEINCTVNEIIDLLNKDSSSDELENNTIGFINALKYVFNNYQKLDLNKDLLFSLYHILNNSDLKLDEYRKYDTELIDIDDSGNEKVVLNPTINQKIDEEISELLNNYDEFIKSGLNPIIYIPIVVFELYIIEPFIDRNDELIRLVLDTLLLKNGFDIVLVESLNEYISKNIREYRNSFYNSVKDSNDEVNYILFINSFMKIFTSYLNENVYKMELKKEKKSERIERMLLESNLPISKSDIREVVKDASLNMIELVLSNLIKEKKIKKIGTFKDAKYIRIE